MEFYGKKGGNRGSNECRIIQWVKNLCIACVEMTPHGCAASVAISTPSRNEPGKLSIEKSDVFNHLGSVKKVRSQ